MLDYRFEGTAIRDLPLGQIVWLLQQLEACDIALDLQDVAHNCIERLRIELTARSLGI